MTRRRQQNRIKTVRAQGIAPQTVDNSKIKPSDSAPLTFRQACRQLWKVFKFKTLPSKYLNKKVKYKGHWHTIEGETADYFFIRAYPKESFPKQGNKYPIR